MSDNKIPLNVLLNQETMENLQKIQLSRKEFSRAKMIRTIINETAESLKEKKLRF
jgi:hypothetical protein